MAIIGALDKTKHFDEFNDPLIGGAEGTKTPDQRKAEARANLGVAGADALAAVVALTNSTGATANNTVENVPAAVASVGADTSAATVVSVNAAITAIENDISDLTAKVNEILAALS